MDLSVQQMSLVAMEQQTLADLDAYWKKQYRSSFGCEHFDYPVDVGFGGAVAVAFDGVGSVGAVDATMMSVGAVIAADDAVVEDDTGAAADVVVSSHLHCIRKLNSVMMKQNVAFESFRYLSIYYAYTVNDRFRRQNHQRDVE